NDVITANISDFIDKVEDPEKMIKQIILEMEENINTAKEGVVDAIASEKTLRQDVDRHRVQSEQWQQNARTALKEGNEELARTALLRKKEHDKILEGLEPTLTSAISTSISLKAQLKALDTKLDEAKRKRSSLVARQRAAEARQDMTKIGATFQQGLAEHADFTRMEDKVAEIEARSQAVSEVYGVENVDQEFRDMQVKSEVDAELEALKKTLEEDET
ncbi:MAG: PspA/IM30 family protein, partial [bacterium]|nr:PspA/IM30 family protein [bacterium]